MFIKTDLISKLVSEEKKKKCIEYADLCQWLRKSLRNFVTDLIVHLNFPIKSNTSDA